jgi:hypothetical protein
LIFEPIFRVRVLDTGVIGLFPYWKEIGTIGTAETFGTGFYRGTAGTIGTGFSQVCSKRWRASIRRSNGKFIPTIPDDSTGFEDSKVVLGSHDAKYLSQDLTLATPEISKAGLWALRVLGFTRKNKVNGVPGGM